MKLLSSIALASVAYAAPSPLMATETTDNQVVDNLDAYQDNFEMQGKIQDFKFGLDQITDGLDLINDGTDVLRSLYSDIEADSMTGTGSTVLEYINRR